MTGQPQRAALPRASAILGGEREVDRACEYLLETAVRQRLGVEHGGLDRALAGFIERAAGADRGAADGTARQLVDGDLAALAQRHAVRTHPLRQHLGLDGRRVLGRQIITAATTTGSRLCCTTGTGSSRACGIARGSDLAQLLLGQLGFLLGLLAAGADVGDLLLLLGFRLVSGQALLLGLLLLGIRFLLLGQTQLLLGLFLALALGQVDLLLAALGFLLLLGLFLRDRQRADRVLVLGVGLRHAFLRLLLLRRRRVLRARLFNRLRRRDGVFRHRDRFGHRRRQVFQLFRLAQGL